MSEAVTEEDMEDEMRSLCIMCMKNEGDPRNGGLCSTCAPRSKRVRHYQRRHWMRLTVRHLQ